MDGESRLGSPTDFGMSERDRCKLIRETVQKLAAALREAQALGRAGAHL